MPVFLIFFLLKIAIVLGGIVFGAYFAAELLPVLATKVIALSDGTAFAPAAEVFADVLQVFARLAYQFIDVIFKVIESVGLDMKGAREGLKDSAALAAGEAKRAVP